MLNRGCNTTAPFASTFRCTTDRQAIKAAEDPLREHLYHEISQTRFNTSDATFLFKKMQVNDSFKSNLVFQCMDTR